MYFEIFSPGFFWGLYDNPKDFVGFFFFKLLYLVEFPEARPKKSILVCLQVETAFHIGCWVEVNNDYVFQWTKTVSSLKI